jgi:hypothetical protein
MQQSAVGVHADDQAIAGLSKWPELPMPRDSNLLSDMSRQLLRIARLPRVSKPAAPVEEEEKDPAEEEEVKEEHKGFSLKRWVQMGKGYDPPEREYLAKRRKGLPPMHDGFVPIYDSLGQTKPMTTLKVRKYDAEGNSHVYEVIAPVGQKVAGEILDDDKAAAVPVEPPAAPGTIIEGLGVVNEEGVVVAQPIRRKPPIPQKRKKKGGPGRSKKKIVPELGPDGVPIHPPLDAHGELMSDAQGITTEGAESGDTPMPDAGDDDDEGSGEEGENSDEDHDVDMSQSSTPVRASSMSNDIKGEAVNTPEVPAGLTPGPSSLRTEIKLESEEPEEPEEHEEPEEPKELEEPEDTEMILEVEEAPIEPPPEPALEPVETVALPQTEETVETTIEAEQLPVVSFPEAMETDPIPETVPIIPDFEVPAIPDLPPSVVEEPTEPELASPSPKPISPPPALPLEVQAPILPSPVEVPVPIEVPVPPQTPPPAEPNGPFSPPKEALPIEDTNELPEEPITTAVVEDVSAEETVPTVELPVVEPKTEPKLELEPEPEPKPVLESELPEPAEPGQEPEIPVEQSVIKEEPEVKEEPVPLAVTEAE